MGREKFNKRLPDFAHKKASNQGGFLKSSEAKSAFSQSLSSGRSFTLSTSAASNARLKNSDTFIFLSLQ